MEKTEKSKSPSKSPSPIVLRALKAGVKLIAAGESPGAASRKLGFTANHLRILRRRYPEVWEAALQDTRHNAAATKPEVGAPLNELRAAAALVASGHSMPRASELLGGNPEYVRKLSLSHPTAWRAALEHARGGKSAEETIPQEVRSAVVAIAGGTAFGVAATSSGISIYLLKKFRHGNPVVWQQLFSEARAAQLPATKTPGDGMKELIRQVLAVMLAGATMKEAAGKVGVDVRAVYKLRERYGEYWNAEEAALRATWAAEGKQIHEGPSEAVRTGIRRATAMLAAGEEHAAIAQALSIDLEVFKWWQRGYPDIWAQELERSMETSTILIRSVAGTNAVVQDLEGYLRRARACAKWTEQQGRELFTPQERATITSFFDNWYKPRRLVDASPKTLAQFRSTCRTWKLLTGDPPLEQITDDTLLMFRDCLMRLPGRDKIHFLSTNTVIKTMKHIQCILDKAGPRGPRNRDAAGILKNMAPWVKPPRGELKEPRFVEMNLFDAVFAATAGMDWPWILPSIKPPAIWRALLVLAFNTQLRRGELFSLRMENIAWDKRLLVLPARRAKNRKPKVVHLNDTAFKFLSAIRGANPRELVFPFAGHEAKYYSQWHKLLTAAGIPRKAWFGLHDTRRTAGTVLFEGSPQAAQLSLDHSSIQTTQRFYIQAKGIVARALDALPQPEAFTGGIANVG